MINSIEKGDTPEAACELIELCPASSPTMDDKFTLTTFDPALVKSVQDAFMDPESCFFCTQVASLAEVAIAQDPGQIDQIRQIADIICDVLPQENKVTRSCADCILTESILTFIVCSAMP